MTTDRILNDQIIHLDDKINKVEEKIDTLRAEYYTTQKKITASIGGACVVIPIVIETVSKILGGL